MKEFSAQFNTIQEFNLTPKDETRNKIYDKAGDDRSILGHTNDMTRWLIDTVKLIINTIDKAKSIDDIKSNLAATRELINSIDTKKESTLQIKGEKQAIHKFIEINHDIAQVLKEQNKLKEVKEDA